MRKPPVFPEWVAKQERMDRDAARWNTEARKARAAEPPLFRNVSSLGLGKPTRLIRPTQRSVEA